MIWTIILRFAIQDISVEGNHSRPLAILVTLTFRGTSLQNIHRIMDAKRRKAVKALHLSENLRAVI